MKDSESAVRGVRAQEQGRRAKATQEHLRQTAYSRCRGEQGAAARLFRLAVFVCSVCCKGLVKELPHIKRDPKAAAEKLRDQSIRSSKAANFISGPIRDDYWSTLFFPTVSASRLLFPKELVTSV